jgi:hypothetical protein
MTLASIITCPHCGTAKVEAMPTDACQFFYNCTGCGATLRQSKGIAAYSVPMVRCHVRRFKAERLGEPGANSRSVR